MDNLSWFAADADLLTIAQERLGSSAVMKATDKEIKQCMRRGNRPCKTA